MNKLKVPKTGTKWQHHKNKTLVYEVIHIANEGGSIEYPLSVVYKGENGKIWVKTNARFYQTMIEVKDD